MVVAQLPASDGQPRAGARGRVRDRDRDVEVTLDVRGGDPAVEPAERDRAVVGDRRQTGATSLATADRPLAASRSRTVLRYCDVDSFINGVTPGSPPPEGQVPKAAGVIVTGGVPVPPAAPVPPPPVTPVPAPPAAPMPLLPAVPAPLAPAAPGPPAPAWPAMFKLPMLPLQANAPVATKATTTASPARGEVARDPMAGSTNPRRRQTGHESRTIRDFSYLHASSAGGHSRTPRGRTRVGTPRPPELIARGLGTL